MLFSRAKTDKLDETNIITGNTKGDENIQQLAGMEFHLTEKINRANVQYTFELTMSKAFKTKRFLPHLDGIVPISYRICVRLTLMY